MAVRDGLAGKRVLLTGVTGFVGEALLERFLSDLPDTRLVLLVRPRHGTSGRKRVEHLLTRPAFASLRERVADLGALLDERVEVLDGDLGAIPDLPGHLDVVVHCAGEVSFDPPIDQGFETNLLGTCRLLEAVHRSGSRPHVVHVSTAYVAGMRKGVVPEATLDHRVDWRAEADAALAARAGAERDSRRPERLRRFTAAARSEHGRAGPQAVAEDAERRRRDWIARQLVEAGRERARTLGWPDVYTLTKAMGERAAEEVAGDLALSIVRPSIIESALERPYPGWIEGFKMAEPIILAYGRGELPDFPGIPDGVIDIIPVDLVVNALLAVAATPVEPGSRAYYHVCSGSRNPLVFERLYSLVREYFERHPFEERGRGAIRLPTWRWRGSHGVERLLRTGERALDAADRVIGHLPRSDRVRSAAQTLDRRRRQLEFLRRYSDLYGPYAEAEVIYTDDRAHELHRSLPVDEVEAFGFDAAVVDWKHYLQEVHCPSVASTLRRMTRRAPRVKPDDGLPTGEHIVAAFDMDGTLISANVVESYLWLRMAELPPGDSLREMLAVAGDLPRYLSAERRDRGAFLRAFYRRYEGADVEGLARLVDDAVAELILQRVSAPAIRRIRAHRAAGHRTVLITGALEVLTRPLAPLFDVVVSAELGTRDGRCTGFLATPPLVGEARAAWLRRYAASAGVELASSYAYADSHSDLPMLAAVGNPVAVNPDVALFRAARRRRWTIEDWKSVEGTPRVLVPERVP